MNTIAAMVASVLAVVGAGSTASTTQTIVAPCVSLERTLSFGSGGSDVIQLQQFLGVKNSGYFGSLTQQKLIAWQIAHSVIPSARSVGAGMVGPKTRAALRCPNAPTPVSAASSPAPSKPVVVPPTPPPATSTAPAPTVNNASSVSGGSESSSNVYTSPAGYSCQTLPPKPAASACTTGPWEVIQDEASCNIWNCSDPSDTQG